VIPKIFFTLRGYSLAILKQDVVAGITVALVAFPLSIGLSVASGARPEAGLVTVIVAGFFISLLGGSRVQIGGGQREHSSLLFTTSFRHMGSMALS
jgi:SulP family sulfate permease